MLCQFLTASGIQLILNSRLKLISVCNLNIFVKSLSAINRTEIGYLGCFN